MAEFNDKKPLEIILPFLKKYCEDKAVQELKKLFEEKNIEVFPKYVFVVDKVFEKKVDNNKIFQENADFTEEKEKQLLLDASRVQLDIPIVNTQEECAKFLIEIKKLIPKNMKKYYHTTLNFFQKGEKKVTESTVDDILYFFQKFPIIVFQKQRDYVHHDMFLQCSERITDILIIPNKDKFEPIKK
jgi:hypothetical protein